MRKLLLLILIGYIHLSESLDQGENVSKQKQGECPISEIITTCECRPEFITCKGDHECPGSQKCCSYGCGCRTSCVEPAGVENVCSLPKVVGPCKAYFPRYWYNEKKNRCEKFIYGGCAGNDNNFKTIKDCTNQCYRKSPRSDYD